MISFKGLAGAGLAAALAAFAMPTMAATAVYSDYASWSAAVSGVTSVNIPDPAPEPYLPLSAGGATVTYGGVTFAVSDLLGDSSFFLIGSGFGASTPMLSSQGQSVGPANIRITFSKAVTGFAFNFGAYTGQNLTLTLSTGETIVRQGGTPIFEDLYTVPDFVGVTSDEAIKSVLVTAPDYIMNIGNVAYETNAVPEPGTWALMLVGFGGLGAALRARRRQAFSAA